MSTDRAEDASRERTAAWADWLRRVRRLSYLPRLALGAVLFERWCRAHALAREPFESYLDHVWEYLEVLPGESVRTWEDRAGELFAATSEGPGAGPEFAALAARLRPAGPAALKALELARNLTALVSASLYSGVDEATTFALVAALARTAEHDGGFPPSLEPFRGCRSAAVQIGPVELPGCCRIGPLRIGKRSDFADRPDAERLRRWRALAGADPSGLRPVRDATDQPAAS